MHSFGYLVPFLYSSRELSELSQWLCYDDTTINIIMVIIIIIIIIIGLLHNRNSIWTKAYRTETQRIKAHLND